MLSKLQKIKGGFIVGFLFCLLVVTLMAHTNRFMHGVKLFGGLVEIASGVVFDGNIISRTDGTDNLGSSSVAWLHAYADTAVANERLDPDSDAGADLGTASLRWNIGYFDEILGNKGADVASATTSFTLGSDGWYFDITGTNNIDSVAAKDAGAVVILQFDGILTMTDGGNLNLNGNHVTEAGDTMVLVCDGTNWYELARVDQN